MRQHDDGLVFAGTVFARNRRIPNSTFYDIGNTTAFQLKSSSEKKERISKRKDSYGQPLDSLASKKPTEISFKLDTFDRKNLAMVLMGEASDLATEAKSVTDETITVKKGDWHKLANDNIDPKSVKVKNAANAAVKAEYIAVNETLGLFMVQAEVDNVQDDEVVKITYSTKGGGGFRIDADAVGDYDLEIMIDTVNRVTGKNGKLHVPSAVISSESDLDFFKDDFNEASFGGTAVLVEGYKTSYNFTEYAKK